VIQNDPSILQKLAVWRSRAMEGTLTEDEMREAILVLRQGRLSASVSASEKAKSASKSRKGPAKSADELLSELDNL